MAFDIELVKILAAMAVITLFWWLIALYSQKFTPWLFRKWIKTQRNDLKEQTEYARKQRKAVDKAYMRATATYKKEDD